MLYYEIIEGKTYRELTTEEKAMIQDRQTELVLLIQDQGNSVEMELLDELLASFKGLIKGMAYRQAEKSFTVEQEDFEGLMWEQLWKSVLTFDRTKEVPFAPVFILNVRNAIKMMYRTKSYDVHDTADKLNRPATFKSQFDNEERATYGERLVSKQVFSNDVVTTVTVDKILNELFKDNDKKKTIVRMYLDGFKRNEIVSAVSEGKVTDGIVRMVNRTVSKFKETYLKLA